MLNKTKIKISFPTLIFFAILIFNLNPMYLIPFISAYLHEIGHVAVMKTCGQNISQIKILPFGIDIQKNNSLSSYKADILISSAGISVNLLLIVLCKIFYNGYYADLFISSNLILIFINILPIKSFDGGQIIETILALKYDLNTADKIIKISSFICIFFIGSFAVWLLFNTSYNFTLLFMSIYLFCGIFLK